MASVHTALRRRWFGPNINVDRVWSRKTIQRRTQERPSWYLSSAELQKARAPLVPRPSRGLYPVKTPLAEREPSPAFLMKQLESEEKEKMATKFPRKMDSFRPGDTIAVTKHVSLYREKYEVIKGFVMTKTRKKDGLEATFTIRNIKLEEPFEMQIPLWSPFIVKIEKLHTGDERRKRLWYVRNMTPEYYEVK